MKKITTILSLAALSVMLAVPLKAVAAEKATTFVPFRSSLVPYIVNHYNDEGDNIKYQWMRLFYEESSWNAGLWADTYYEDSFTAADGRTLSTKGVQTTYNEDYDYYLGRTLIKHPGFLEELLTCDKTETVAHKYMELMADSEHPTAVGHEVLANTILQLTADGYLLDKATDLGVEDDLLRIYVGSYSRINALQKNWVKEHVKELYADYVMHHDDGKALAAKANNSELYDLIARSTYAVNGSYYTQEFFNYIVSSGKSLGQWICMTNGLSDEMNIAGLEALDTYSQLLQGDMDCPGGCDLDAVDSDGDYWVYYLNFKTGTAINRVRALIKNNITTGKAMSKWREGFISKHAPEVYFNEEYRGTKEAPKIMTVYTLKLQGTYKVHGSDTALEDFYHRAVFERNGKSVNNTMAVQAKASGNKFTTMDVRLEEASKTIATIGMRVKYADTSITYDGNNYAFRNSDPTTYLLLDVSGPTVVVDKPTGTGAGLDEVTWTTDSSYVTTGTATDPSGLADVEVTIKNSKSNATLNDCQIGNKFTVRTSTLPKDETTEISVRAKDTLGNWSSPIVRYVRRDSTGPKINITSPTGTVNYTILKGKSKTITVTGTCTDAGGVTSLKANDGTSISVDSSGNWTYTKTLTGSETLTFTATDRAGNTSSKSLQVNIETVVKRIYMDDNLTVTADNAASTWVSRDYMAAGADHYFSDEDGSGEGLYVQHTSNIYFSGLIKDGITKIKFTRSCYGTNGTITNEVLGSIIVIYDINGNEIDAEYLDDSYTYNVPADYQDGLHYFKITNSYMLGGDGQVGGWNRATVTLQ